MNGSYDAIIKATEKNIYNVAIANGFEKPLALLLVAQAKHETGNFTSHIFVTGNNCFGYTYVNGAKWQLHDSGVIADNQQPSAKYFNVEDSVNEMCDWIKRRIAKGVFPQADNITTSEQYATLLKRAGYYGDTLANYLAGINHYYKDNIV